MSDPLASLQSHYLLLVLGEDLYAVPLRAVVQMRAAAAPTALDAVPDYILGCIEHAGERLPLLDLRGRLKLPAAGEHGRTVTVVVSTGGRRLGVVVDTVAEVADLGVPDGLGEARHDHDSRADLAYLKGAAAVGERMALILDLQQLLSPAERVAIDAAMQSETEASRGA